MIRSLSTIMAISSPALALFIACSSEQKTKDANSYLARIISKTDQVVNIFNAFIQQSSYNQLDSMKASTMLLQSVASANIDTLGKLEDYKGSGMLREEAVAYIKSLQDINDHEFKEFIRIYSIPETQFTDADNRKIDSVSNSLDNKVSVLTNRFVKAQTQFAKENNIKLTFNFEMDSMMKRGVDTSVILN